MELAKLARQQDQRFESATWLHKARQMPKAEFQREVKKELMFEDSAPSELIYFKVYESQILVIEQAIETAALMLGSGKSRGYCLEMICADFLAQTHRRDWEPIQHCYRARVQRRLSHCRVTHDLARQSPGRVAIQDMGVAAAVFEWCFHPYRPKRSSAQ